MSSSIVTVDIPPTIGELVKDNYSREMRFANSQALNFGYNSMSLAHIKNRYGGNMNTNILELNNDNFDVEMSAGLCFVDFWAVWCGPCKMLAPVVEELAVECVGKMKFGKVNVDIEESLSAKYMVMNIPTMVILENGVEVERIVGFRPKAQILEIINKHLTK